jgi:hypothetical protein
MPSCFPNSYTEGCLRRITGKKRHYVSSLSRSYRILFDWMYNTCFCKGLKLAFLGHYDSVWIGWIDSLWYHFRQHSILNSVALSFVGFFIWMQWAMILLSTNSLRDLESLHWRVREMNWNLSHLDFSMWSWMCGCFEMGKCRRSDFAVPIALGRLAAALQVVKCSHRSKTGSRDAQTGRNILQLDSNFHWRIISVLITTLPLLHSAIQPFIIKVFAFLLGGPQFQNY